MHAFPDGRTVFSLPGFGGRPEGRGNGRSIGAGWKRVKSPRSCVRGPVRKNGRPGWSGRSAWARPDQLGVATIFASPGGKLQ